MNPNLLQSSSRQLTSEPSEGLESASLELKKLVIQAVTESLGDSILLSGGLDTSIVAGVVSSVLKANDRGEDGNFRAYTVILDGAPSSPDLEYSRLVSGRFGIPHKILSIDLSELEASLSEMISVLESFDPMEIRNSIAVYLGMKRARIDGCSEIMTGDAADELFAGYSFVFKQAENKAQETLSRLWEVMRFSSIPLARSLGMEAKLPFLHPCVREFATRKIKLCHLVGRKEGSDEQFGKFVLRKAFEDELPTEVVWRTKTPIEYGSGTTILPKWYSESITDAEYVDKKKQYLERDGVRLRDKEQLKYFEIYRKILGPPVPKDRNRRQCPACTSNVPESVTFCTTCGEYPI